MPLDKAPLVWRILRRLPEWLKDPRFAPLAHYLGDDTQGSRAFGLAQQLADVLDGYQNYRADWLERWAARLGRAGPGQALPPEQAWQAAMWRDLLADVQTQLPVSTHWVSSPLGCAQSLHASAEGTDADRSTCHRQACRHVCWCLASPRLPLQTLEALVALGALHSGVDVCAQPQPSEHWGHLTESIIPEGHPLLAAWGKHGRDYLHAIDEL